MPVEAALGQAAVSPQLEAVGCCFFFLLVNLENSINILTGSSTVK